MRKEVEVKAKIQSSDDLMARLAALDVSFSPPIEQEDRVFARTLDPFPAKPEDIFLRIRKSGGKIVFTLKQPQLNGLDKIEHEVEVDDAAETEAMIRLLGYQEISFIKKSRRKANYKDCEICVDVVDGLGSFIEMEKITDDEGDSARIQNEMFSFLETLGIKKEDRVFQGYDVLMSQKDKR